jgi:hypothetical protein
VLKTIIRGTKLDELDDASDDEDIQVDERTTANKTRLRLLGIVTAFELLSGQGKYPSPWPVSEVAVHELTYTFHPLRISRRGS